MFIHRIPAVFPRLFPRFTWFKKDERRIYLTFDDGPTPEITDFVLETLAAYDAKATFFCIGKNIEAHPAILQRIHAAGHSIGNHTMNHVNAWSVSSSMYQKEIDQCDELLKQQHITSIGFRPPYGRLTRYMYKEIATVYLWSVLTGDYNSSLDSQKIVEQVKPLLKPGAIVVMHDSVKAAPHLRHILPQILAYCTSQNYLISAL